jgi:hypothetical protein
MLDGHENARLEYEAVCDSISQKLRAMLEGLAHLLPLEVSTHPWDHGVLESLTSRTWYAEPGEVLPEKRRYSPDPQQLLDGLFASDWGGYHLTQSLTNGDQYLTVHRLHSEFREIAESLLPGLSESTKRLKGAAAPLADYLEDIIVKQSMAGP